MSDQAPLSVHSEQRSDDRRRDDGRSRDDRRHDREHRRHRDDDRDGRHYRGEYQHRRDGDCRRDDRSYHDDRRSYRDHDRPAYGADSREPRDDERHHARHRPERRDGDADYDDRRHGHHSDRSHRDDRREHKHHRSGGHGERREDRGRRDASPGRPGKPSNLQDASALIDSAMAAAASAPTNPVVDTPAQRAREGEAASELPPVLGAAPGAAQTAPDAKSSGLPVAAGGLKSKKLTDASALLDAALEEVALPPAPPKYASHEGDHRPTALGPPPAAAGRIFVGNLNFLATEADVRSVFSRFGIISQIIMRTDPVRGTHRGYAIIEYIDVESSRRARAVPADRIRLGGIPVRIDATPNDKDTTVPEIDESFAAIDHPVARTMLPTTSSNTLAQKMAAARGLLAPGAAGTGGPGDSHALNSALHPPGTNSSGFVAGGGGHTGVGGPTAIVISGMVRSVDEVDSELFDDLKRECGKFGPVLDVNFFIADEKEGPNVAVEFATQEAARNCQQKMNGRLFDGRPLRSSILSREYYDEVKNA